MHLMSPLTIFFGEQSGVDVKFQLEICRAYIYTYSDCMLSKYTPMY